MPAKEQVTALLRAADIEINGNDAWDPRVHDDRFFARVLAHGNLGAGESYMDGWWDVGGCPASPARRSCVLPSAARCRCSSVSGRAPSR